MATITQRTPNVVPDGVLDRPAEFANNSYLDAGEKMRTLIQQRDLLVNLKATGAQGSTGTQVSAAGDLEAQAEINEKLARIDEAIQALKFKNGEVEPQNLIPQA